MLLSVVIPVFNEEQFLANTVARIQHAVTGAGLSSTDWELIVCDNASTDASRRIAARHGAKVVSESQRQIAKVRNTGAAAANGDWLLFVDADSYPSVELVSDLLAKLADGGFVGCGSTIQVEGGSLLNRLRMERLNPFFRLLRLSGGAFICCRADAFRAIGGFDTELYAFEDIDFVIRLKRYSRTRKLRFAVFHRHPVVTSGRRGELSAASIASLILSNFAATLLFAFRFVLPRKWTRSLGKLASGYWYRARK